MDIELMLFLLSIGVFMLGAIDFFTNFRQWRTIKTLQGNLGAEIEEWKGKGSVGDQFGAWLLARPEGKDPDGKDLPSNLESCAVMVGRQMYQSVSMAAKGVLSGESRTLRGVEKAVLEGIQTPETKALLGFCDEIGVNRELAGSVLQILESRGLLPQILKNNGSSQGGESSVW